MLAPILDAIIRKMRYDETTTWGNEDEQTDEAEFQELRRKLQNLQKTIAAIDQPLYMDMLSNLVATTFQNLDQQGTQMDWRDLDLALYEMFLFGELALPNQGLGTKNQPSPEASERLVVMMRKMVESGLFPISAISHLLTTKFRHRQLLASRHPPPVYGDLRSLLCRIRELSTSYPSRIGKLCSTGSSRSCSYQDSILVSFPPIC